MSNLLLKNGVIGITELRKLAPILERIYTICTHPDFSSTDFSKETPRSFPSKYSGKSFFSKTKFGSYAAYYFEYEDSLQGTKKTATFIVNQITGSFNIPVTTEDKTPSSIACDVCVKASLLATKLIFKEKVEYQSSQNLENWDLAAEVLRVAGVKNVSTVTPVLTPMPSVPAIAEDSTNLDDEIFEFSADSDSTMLKHTQLDESQMVEFGKTASKIVAIAESFGLVTPAILKTTTVPSSIHFYRSVYRTTTFGTFVGFDFFAGVKVREVVINRTPSLFSHSSEDELLTVTIKAMLIAAQRLFGSDVTVKLAPGKDHLMCAKQIADLAGSIPSTVVLKPSESIWSLLEA